VIHILVVAPQEYVNIYSTRRPVTARVNPALQRSAFATHPLSLGLYTNCYHQYCMVYGIQTEGRGRILPNGRAMVLQKCSLCRWEGNERMMDSHKKV